MRLEPSINLALQFMVCAVVATQGPAVYADSKEINRKLATPQTLDPKVAKLEGGPVADSASCVLSAAQLATTEKAALAGDGDAAATLYIHYAIGMQDPGGKAVVWLYRGAKLGQTTCMINLASFIKEGLLPPEPIAKGRSQAVKKLLLSASAKDDPDAHRMLAECYSDGYFGTVDRTLGRKHSILAKQAERKHRKDLQPDH